jgi:two-component system CheB/CheR fusion protein
MKPAAIASSRDIVHGDGTRPVTVALAAAGQTVSLITHNHGTAIPRSAMPTLFDPFTRADGQRRRGGGVGLGLYIVDQIARAHGGRVEVASDDELGTTFVVDLPIRHDDGRRRHDGERPLVLVVDDDDDMREGTAALLEQNGYTVAQARHGADALHVLRAGLRPGLMLVDLNMPVMDGPTFCDACRADPALADIPVVIISGDADAIAKATRAGAVSVLAKPVPGAALAATVAHAIGG